MGAFDDVGGWTWPAMIQRCRPSRSPPPITAPYWNDLSDTWTNIGERSWGNRKWSHGLYGSSEDTAGAADGGATGAPGGTCSAASATGRAAAGAAIAAIS